ncbi:MAG: HPr family phosphocarrier protein [Lachnospiraceae bacterium]|nr:HPr family phosphocarrier protein [Lachnospiraceae bacterium]
MIKKNVKIQLDSGLDVRPVAVLVQVANRFSSQIYIRNDKHRFNAKSIMGMMTLCTENATDLEITADGADEEEAVAQIEKYLSGQSA